MVPRGKVGNSQHFPTNLHILLDEAEKAGHADIVSWCSQGQSFRIHDSEALVPLLAKYFRQTKFKSFLRQLQSYDFNRTTRGCDKGIVSHPLFVRGRRSLCFQMTRKRAVTSTVSQSGLGSSSDLLFSRSAVPSNGIAPIRKAFSSSAIRNQRMELQRLAKYAGMSEMKNATFDLQGNSTVLKQPVMFDPKLALNSHVLKKATSDPDIAKRPSHALNYKTQQKRGYPAPTIMKNPQRGNVLECTGIDHSLKANVCLSDVRTSQEACRDSIIESSSTMCGNPQQVPSQHEAFAHSHRGQNYGEGYRVQYVQDQVPCGGQDKECQGRQSNSLQSKVQPQTTQRPKSDESQNQVQHQTIPHDQRHARQGHYQQAQVRAQNIQHQQNTQPQAELVYSQNNTLIEIKELRENMTKQLACGDQGDQHPPLKVQSHGQIHITNETHLAQHETLFQQQMEHLRVQHQHHQRMLSQHHRQQRQQQQQQQQEQQQQQQQQQQQHHHHHHQQRQHHQRQDQQQRLLLTLQRYEPQGKQQTQFAQPSLSLHQSTQMYPNSTHYEPVAPVESSSNDDVLLGSGPPVTPDCSYHQSPKSTALYIHSAPPSDFNLSFSTTEFQVDYGVKGDDSKFSTLKAPTPIEGDGTCVTTSAPSFSAAIATNAYQTGELTSSDVLATGGYSAMLHLTTAKSLEPSQKKHTVAPTSFSHSNNQRQQQYHEQEYKLHQQQQYQPPEQQQQYYQQEQQQQHCEKDDFGVLPLTTLSRIESGTVDSHLRKGEGMEEWDLDLLL